MYDIQMVDLKGQYNKIKIEIDEAIQSTIDATRFIGGAPVQQFSQNLADYLGTPHISPCANGTDALQLALMALGLERGDEILVPAFTYVATAEVIALLGLTPIMVDVELDTFNIKIEGLQNKITENTKAIVPVHLYGQAADMETLLQFAKENQLFVIEDNAQSIGGNYSHGLTNGKTGTLGDIGTFSFFPSKNLGCYGDGGAISTNNADLAAKLKMIASHGQAKKYYHEVVGVNSRLDSLQAAILDVKLKYLDQYISNRQEAATYYDTHLNDIDQLIIPGRIKSCNHVFHQYTLRILNGKRDELKQHLANQGIPTMIYYPLPLYKQKAYKNYVPNGFELPNTEQLCTEVLSIPMHTELDQVTQDYIINNIKSLFT